MFGAIPGSLVTVVTVLLLVGGTGCSACVAHKNPTIRSSLSSTIVSGGRVDTMRHAKLLEFCFVQL